LREQVGRWGGQRRAGQVGKGGYTLLVKSLLIAKILSLDKLT